VAAVESPPVKNRTLAWRQEATGPASLTAVMEEIEKQAINGEVERLRPLATGFTPLDDILNGGLRTGVRRGKDDLGAAGRPQRRVR
jgi:replicative DNA helicase